VHEFIEAFRFIAHNGAVSGHPGLPSLSHLALETLKVGAIGVAISIVLALPLFVIRILVTAITSLPITLHQFGQMMQHGVGAGPLAPPPDSLMILSQIMTFVAVSAILPLYVLATTLFYYDIRIRREGFDLEHMAGQMGRAR